MNVQVKESNGIAAGAPSNDAEILEDKLGPLKDSRPTLPSVGSNPDIPTLAHRSSSIGRTPPITPPGRCGSPGSPHLTSSPRSAGSPHVKKIVAPATAVDDVMERWGRPRAHSFSRREREKVSLPVWEEEGDECGSAPLPSLEDRRRTVSMPAAFPDSTSDRDRTTSMPDTWNMERVRRNIEDLRGGYTLEDTMYRDKPLSTENHAAWHGNFSQVQSMEIYKQCAYRECHLQPFFGVEGEAPSFCREHKLPCMVNVMDDRCEHPGCNLAPTYGFLRQGRQRCFSHKEPGMVHALRSTIHEPLSDEDATPMAVSTLGTRGRWG